MMLPRQNGMDYQDIFKEAGKPKNAVRLSWTTFLKFQVRTFFQRRMRLVSFCVFEQFFVISTLSPIYIDRFQLQGVLLVEHQIFQQERLIVFFEPRRHVVRYRRHRQPVAGVI